MNYCKDCKETFTKRLDIDTFYQTLKKEGVVVREFMAFKDELKTQPKAEVKAEPKAKEQPKPKEQPKAKAKPNNNDIKDVFNKVIDSQIEQQKQNIIMFESMRNLVDKIS